MASSADSTQEQKNAHYRAVFQAYVQAINARRVEAILSLFAEDAELRDPVGSRRRVKGMSDLQTFYTEICARGMRMSIDGHISGSKGNAACAPIRVDLKTSITHVISVAQFDDEGLITRYDAHWGIGDIEYLEG